MKKEDHLKYNFKQLTLIQHFNLYSKHVDNEDRVQKRGFIRQKANKEKKLRVGAVKPGKVK